jgi:nucleoid-associated protein YgaU
MKEDIPQFKLMGVHMSGLRGIEEDDSEVKVGKGSEITKKTWGSQKQVQSGSRWLLAQGMTKSSSKQHSLLKSKGSAPSAQTKVKPGETLWSISARVNGSGQKWRDLAALNPHIRNPDVIFSNETIRTK